AHDGRQAAIWVVRKKGIPLTKDTPLYLYGYGGFGVSLHPHHPLRENPWFANGGVAAYVSLPGGMEYGRKWMHAGQLHHKRNVFDDFAAAAQELIDRGYTSPEKLAMGGGSNGGLLVAATSNLYPH